MRIWYFVRISQICLLLIFHHNLVEFECSLRFATKEHEWWDSIGILVLIFIYLKRYHKRTSNLTSCWETKNYVTIRHSCVQSDIRLWSLANEGDWREPYSNFRSENTEKNIWSNQIESWRISYLIQFWAWTLYIWFQ